MATTEDNGRMVKLQIPVSADLGARIASLAERFERSQAWLASEALQVAVEDQKNFAVWVFDLLMGKANRVLRAMGNRPLHNPDIVRLQVPVPEALAEEIATMGDKVGHSQVRMAGLLLEWLIDGHELVMYAASSAPAKSLGRLLYAKRKSDGERVDGAAGGPDTPPASSCE